MRLKITRKALAITAATAVIAAIVASVTGYLMVTHRPEYYNPVQLTQLQQQDAMDQALHKVEQLHNDIFAGEPFLVSFDDKLLNKLLLCDELNERKSEKFDQIQLHLGQGLIELMTTVDLRGISTVVTMGFKPQTMDDGTIELQMEPVKAGTVVVPQTIVEKQKNILIKKISRQIEKRKTNKDNMLSKQIADNLLETIQQLIQKGYANTQMTFNVDDTKVKVVDITVNQGSIDVSLEPVNQDN